MGSELEKRILNDLDSWNVANSKDWAAGLLDIRSMWRSSSRAIFCTNLRCLKQNSTPQKPSQMMLMVLVVIIVMMVMTMIRA